MFVAMLSAIRMAAPFENMEIYLTKLLATNANTSF